jgi:hypothetical protein
VALPPSSTKIGMTSPYEAALRRMTIGQRLPYRRRTAGTRWVRPADLGLSVRHVALVLASRQLAVEGLIGVPSRAETAVNQLSAGMPQTWPIMNPRQYSLEDCSARLWCLGSRKVKIDATEPSLQIRGQMMGWSSLPANGAGLSPGRLIFTVLGLAGAAVLASCGNGGLVGPAAVSVGAAASAVPVICPQVASTGATKGPIVTGISPQTGSEKGGVTVTINGDGFSGATEVIFGTKKAEKISVTSDTRIIAISPPSLPDTNVCVSVVTPNGRSVSSPAEVFTYLSPAETQPTDSPS